eukprot:COSAG01_NODE_1024_length_12058_cov_91.598211_7_plen_61_part_00
MARVDSDAAFEALLAPSVRFLQAWGGGERGLPTTPSRWVTGWADPLPATRERWTEVSQNG